MTGEINSAAVLPAVGSDLVVETRPIPMPGPNEVLIRAHVVAVNPVDKPRQALGFMVPTVPTVLGSDLAGTVVAVGSEVGDVLHVGDRVVTVSEGFVTGHIDHGAFQTYVVSPALTTAKLPDHISFQDGATVSLVAMVAVLIFFDAFRFALPDAKAATPTSSPPSVPLPPPGTIVLVWGGASCVGSQIIQMAHLFGFTVYTTASTRHHARLRELGADVAVDYHEPDVAVQQLVAAAQKDGNKAIEYAVDAVSIAGTTVPLVEKVVMATKAAAAAAASTTEVTAATTPRLLLTVPLPKNYAKIGGIDYQFVNGIDIWLRRQDLGRWLFHDNLTSWLAKKVIVPPLPRVVPGGLGGLQQALNEVKGVTGEKLVVELD
ncbi:Alcohol dehydrogenase superfamily, zinc-type [Niveomyces insectorum RCEF 264]|uniref:Alcohol dehydrogenase superfamily, zinc-type n=1 Tax=Niveomyces insectorum RCEF 264 TaxID=1081102 RepID=A0A167WFF9_9HYPO|nr:Alcohol dehydrogenase superfamily, zinc-type [Niveomyces insectorum RCEF 264]